MAHQIAHPESIKQGDKDTCLGANAEKTMTHNHPDTYADMVSKLATTESTPPLVAAEKRWQKGAADGTLDPNEKQQTLSKFTEM